MQHWSLWPWWLRGGIFTTLLVALLEGIYIAMVVHKASHVMTAFSFHIALLSPVILLTSFFGRPLFLIQHLIPSTGGLLLIATFWFVVGAIIGLVIDLSRSK